MNDIIEQQRGWYEAREHEAYERHCERVREIAGENTHGELASMVAQLEQELADAKHDIEQLTQSLSAEVSAQPAVTDEQAESLIHFARFMCGMWEEMQGWAVRHFSENNVADWPQLQGTSQQRKIREIGLQPCDSSKITEAVRYLNHAALPIQGTGE